MHIRKQRLLTPGPTPLYPPALHAMMASDIHHRTEEFRNVYRSALADLKEVYGTANDVLCFAASGTGAMDASVSNLFSPGDKVIVCTAGKFGERWVEIAKAYGLDANVLKAEYGDVVTPDRVEAALKAEPGTKGVFMQASETSTGAEHDVQTMAGLIKNTDAIFVVDAITGLGTMPLDIDGWGLDVVIGGSQKAFMIPPGLAFMSVSPKAWKLSETLDAASLLLQSQEGKEERRRRRIQLDSGHLACSRAGRSAEIRQKDGRRKSHRERATSGARHPGRFRGNRPRTLRQTPRKFRDRRQSPRSAWIPASSSRTSKNASAPSSPTARAPCRARFSAWRTSVISISRICSASSPGLELILRANGHNVELGTGVAAVQRTYESAQAKKANA